MKHSALTKYSALLIALIIIIAGAGIVIYSNLALKGGKTESIKIGVLLPFAGPFAAGGIAANQSLQIAAEEINSEGGILGKKVILVTGDTQGRPDSARTQALKLIDEDRVSALIGAYLSEETIAVEDIAADRKIILMVPISASLEITQKVVEDYSRYKYIFRISYNITQWAQLLGSFIDSMNVQNYSYVGVDIRWNREFGQSLKVFLESRGVKEVSEDLFYSPRNPVVDPIVLTLKEKNPDIIVLGDPGRGSIQMVKEIRENRLRSAILSVGGTLGDERVVKSLEPGSYLYFQAASWSGANDRSTAYFNKFREHFQYQPVGYSDTLPHDALKILAQAINKAGSLDPDKIVNVLESEGFESLAGTYRFNMAHQAVWAAGSQLSGVVVQWSDGTSRVVWPSRSES